MENLKGRAKRRRLKAQQQQQQQQKRPPTAEDHAAAAVSEPAFAMWHARQVNGGGGNAAAGASAAAQGEFNEADFVAHFREIDESESVVMYSAHNEAGARNRVGFPRMLQSVRPRYIVLYEPDLALMRQIEVYANQFIVFHRESAREH